ncbi:MAG TPA: YkgJ family cysteine cluster protein [Vicinamibacterales bacterium]|nr:YkgJ family cysteine cluster protein [Vicinamibacterales bacterium]
MTAAEREAYRQRLDVFFASRDVGHALTAEPLQRGVTPAALTSAAAAVASYADDGLAVVRDEYQPRLACREGCSYCCRKPGVLVTRPEFVRILEHVRSSFDADARAALARGARAYVERLGGRHFDAAIADSVPCPLLVDDRCSVYPIRPLVCRGYNSTDAAACQAAHADPAALVPIFAMLKDVTDGAAVGVAHALREAGGSGAMIDLGTALAIVLAAGDGVDRRIGADGGLDAAENVSWADEMWTLVSDTARRLERQPR